MSRKFIGQKELAFISAINKEFIQKVVDQEVYYYEILVEKTNRNSLYNEALTKTYAAPVKANCLLYYQNTTEQIGSLPPDAKFPLDVYFHVGELQERNLLPKMGDFLQFGQVMYEIYSVTQPQIVYGMIDQKVMYKCTAGPARQGQFAPPVQPMPVPHPDQSAPLYPTQPAGRARDSEPRNKS
jgi:hypothetical protein